MAHGEPKIWQREPNEPNLWFDRFNRFRLLGPRRSLLAVYNAEQADKSGTKRRKTPGAWDAAAKEWRWRERAEGWDAYCQRREERNWEARRKHLRRKQWDMSQSLLDKADQMLKFPLAKTTREDKSADGKLVSVTTVFPARWSMRDAAAVTEAAAKLARLTLDDGENHEGKGDWREEARSLGLDPDALFERLVDEFTGHLADSKNEKNQITNGEEANTEEAD